MSSCPLLSSPLETPIYTSVWLLEVVHRTHWCFIATLLFQLICLQIHYFFFFFFSPNLLSISFSAFYYLRYYVFVSRLLICNFLEIASRSLIIMVMFSFIFLNIWNIIIITPLILYPANLCHFWIAWTRISKFPLVSINLLFSLRWVIFSWLFACLIILDWRSAMVNCTLLDAR